MSEHQNKKKMEDKPRENSLKKNSSILSENKLLYLDDVEDVPEENNTETNKVNRIERCYCLIVFTYNFSQFSIKRKE